MDGAAPPAADFRLALRAATRADHDRVDALVSGLDIGTAEGFARFARVHLACFSALRAAAVVEGLDAMIEALGADLATLAPGARPGPAALAPVDPLAAAYMVEGSRMGTRLLRARWAASTDPAVRAASRYFDLPAPPDAWRAVRDALSDIPPGSPRAARIEADARRVFALFARTLDATA